MKKQAQVLVAIVACLFFSMNSFAQGEANQWRFGNQAGLDFSTTPPSTVAPSAMSAVCSGASVSDAAGNLLFYTDGTTVWDYTNSTMANGSGLNGTINGSRGVMALKQPGTSTYYIFTCNLTGTVNGLYYSIVDMSLASGSGSVTVKNVPLAIGSGSSIIGKLTATRHCNNSDIWLVYRDSYNNFSGTGTVTANNSFRAFLLTSSGINTTAVVSTPITYTTNSAFAYIDYAEMKLSPNGKNLAVANYAVSLLNPGAGAFELYDFDNATGAVSNAQVLLAASTSTNYSWGVEFSPDGSKLYGSLFGNSGKIYQWDLCAGSFSAVAASQYTVATSSSVYGYTGLQLGPDGKIYISCFSASALDVINAPNSAGSACSYSAAALSLGSQQAYYGLPNFMSSYLLHRPALTPFTSTVSPLFGCQTASFNTIYAPGVVPSGCAATGYSITGIQWFFGDPASGAADASTQQNPLHAFSAPGSYSVLLVLNYDCIANSDTIRSVVNIHDPCISVNSTSITCATLGSATVTIAGAGPFSYTWMPSGQTGSVATGVRPGTYTVTIYDYNSSSTYTAAATFNSLVPFTGSLAFSNSVSCYGSSTGTAAVASLAGGSGSQSYLWSNGVNSYTAPMPLNLSTGNWSVSVTDDLTGCNISNTFSIQQPPAQTLTIASSTACAGVSVTLTGTASGGTGSTYNYSWTSGPATNTWAVSQAAAGTVIYTLSSTDANSCIVSNTAGVTFVSNPVLNVSNVSICPLQTGTLTASGANSYTWSTSSSTMTGNTFTDSPASSTVYTVTGSSSGCTATATPSITLKPVPVATLSSNSPVCMGQLIQLSGNGGSGYQWTGPSLYTSSAQNPALLALFPGNAGVYSATVTAVNNCTAFASITVSINPQPTVSVSGSNILCAGSSVTQTAAGAVTYSWNGTASGTTATLSPAATMIYTVTGANAAGCTGTTAATITVNALPVLSVSGNASVCAGNSVVETVSGAISYSWSTGATTNTVLLTPGTTSVYSVSGTDANNCTGTATQTITVIALPVVAIAGSGSLCAGLPDTLTGSGAATYSWSTGATTSTISVSSQTTATYSLTGTDVSGCSNSASLSVTVYPLPTLTIAGSTAVCAGALLSQTVSGAVSYSWSNGAGTNTVALSPSGNTVYTVTGIDSNGCEAITSESVTVNALPVLNTSQSNPVLCSGETGTLSATGANSWLWNTGAITASLSVTPSVSTTYSVTGTTTLGCSASATVTQLVDNCTGIKNPGQNESGLSVWPNPGDGLFYLRTNNGQLPLKVSVYNALGILIQQEQLNSESQTLNLTHAAKGLYYFVIYTGETQYIKQVIKE